MLSRHLAKSTRPVFQSVARQTYRPLSISAARMAAGDTGAPKSGGVAQADAFSKREQADENYYVRQREKEKLMALKQKISEQQKHLKELEKHIDELSAESGGEKN